MYTHIVFIAPSCYIFTEETTKINKCLTENSQLASENTFQILTNCLLIKKYKVCHSFKWILNAYLL
jgi:hypothetical protein